VQVFYGPLNTFLCACRGSDGLSGALNRRVGWGIAAVAAAPTARRLRAPRKTTHQITATTVLRLTDRRGR
jgi:hypothetical protein